MLKPIFTWGMKHKLLVIVLILLVSLFTGMGYCTYRLAYSIRCGTGFFAFEAGHPVTPVPFPKPGEEGYIWSAITPQWTPDGESIVFTHSTGRYVDGFRALQIYTISPDGSALRLVLDDVLLTSDYLNYDSDGSRITYTVHRNTGENQYFYEIETASLDGTDRQSITTPKAFNSSPSWSPDGSQIAFKRRVDFCSGHGGADKGLFVMASNGDDFRKLAVPPSPEDLEEVRVAGVPDWQSINEWAYGINRFTWSPDGREIAYAADVYYGETEFHPIVNSRRYGIYIVNTDGSPPKRAFDFEVRSRWGHHYGSFVGSPEWTPDGKRIVFLRNVDGRLKFFSIDKNGEDLREMVDMGLTGVTRHVSSCGPAWSPDASRIMFSIDSTTFVVNVDGSGVQSFGGSSCGTWSPDGSMFVSAENGLRVVTIGTGETRALTALSDSGELVSLTVDMVVMDESSNQAACLSEEVLADLKNNPDLVHDCEVLLRVRDRLAGSGSLNWNAQTPIFEWDGVLLDTLPVEAPDTELPEESLPLRVRQISLPEHGLSGVIPAGIGELNALEYLDLSSNKLAGNIPIELGKLSGLIELNVDSNRLIGSIPKELGMLSNLRVLRLEGSRFGGSIPAELGNLTQLETLHLSAVGISGILPKEFFGMTSLRHLDLGSTSIEGNLPPEVGSLRQLRALDLSRTGIGGQLPVELYELTELQELYLDHTDILGPLLPQIGNLKQLTKLDLSRTLIDGPIPLELEHLSTHLTMLDIENTDLHGCIPRSMRRITERDRDVSICEP